jgi:hypothetical protein
VNVGSSGIKAEFDPQRFACFAGPLELGLKVLLADKVNSAFLYERELFVDGHKITTPVE